MGLSPNGVLVKVAGVAAGSRITVQVCVAGKCTTATAEYDVSVPMAVANPGISSAAPISITATVRDAAGKVLVLKRRLTVTPVKSQPNGPGCEPTGYFATADVALRGPTAKAP